MPERIFTLDDFSFDLPEELIAQYPPEKREAARLLVLDRRNNTMIHSEFLSLGRFLDKNDILVFNNTRVMHARIPCRRGTGGSCELLLTERIDRRSWSAITNRTKRIKPGETIRSAADPSITFDIRKISGDSLEVESSIDLDDGALASIGQIALPPYIKRSATSIDDDRYQTVYAKEIGAVAAPTAGLHFTEEMMSTLMAMGVRSVFLTLHVSWGTFQPVRTRNIERHSMHSESYLLPENSAAIINDGRKSGCRIIAVGTTSLRVLEATYRDGLNEPGKGKTDIFIYPPREILSADALITNFHTPHSTLLMLVSAFAGHDRIMEAYHEAVRLKYRFFSYGDAMLII